MTSRSGGSLCDNRPQPAGVDTPLVDRWGDCVKQRTIDGIIAMATHSTENEDCAAVIAFGGL